MMTIWGVTTMIQSDIISQMFSFWSEEGMSMRITQNSDHQVPSWKTKLIMPKLVWVGSPKIMFGDYMGFDNPNRSEVKTTRLTQEFLQYLFTFLFMRSYTQELSFIVTMSFQVKAVSANTLKAQQGLVPFWGIKSVCDMDRSAMRQKKASGSTPEDHRRRSNHCRHRWFTRH